MHLRLLVILIFLWGTTGAAVCQAACLELPAGAAHTSAGRSDSPQTSHCEKGSGPEGERPEPTGDPACGCLLADAGSPSAKILWQATHGAGAAPTADLHPLYGPPLSSRRAGIPPARVPVSPWLRHNPPLLT